MTRQHLGRVLTDLCRPAWWACLWRGHEPDEDRDWVGRPVCCARCHRYDAEMARWQYNRFCGVAARMAWDREALAPYVSIATVRFRTKL